MITRMILVKVPADKSRKLNGCGGNMRRAIDRAVRLQERAVPAEPRKTG